MHFGLFVGPSDTVGSESFLIPTVRMDPSNSCMTGTASISHAEVKFPFYPPTLPVPAGRLAPAKGIPILSESAVPSRWRSKRVNNVMVCLLFYSLSSPSVYFQSFPPLMRKWSLVDGEGEGHPCSGLLSRKVSWDGHCSQTILCLHWSLLGFAQNLICALEQKGWLDLADSSQTDTLTSRMYYIFYFTLFSIL